MNKVIIVGTTGHKPETLLTTTIERYNNVELFTVDEAKERGLITENFRQPITFTAPPIPEFHFQNDLLSGKEKRRERRRLERKKSNKQFNK